MPPFTRNRQGTHLGDRDAQKRWGWYLGIFASLLICGLVIYPLDLKLAGLLQKIGDLPGDFRRVLALSELVAHGTGVAIILVIIWCLSPHQRLHIPRVAACAFLAGLVATGLKLVHGRLRPLSCPPEIDLVGKTWRGWWPSFSEQIPNYDYALQSFPSAHTATAVGFAVGLTWLYPRGKFVFFTLAMLAGLQRVVFVAHWPSDVVFGAAVGIFMGGCFVLPGTLGNHLFNRLEWRFGIGKELNSVAVTTVMQPAPENESKRAA